MYCHLVWEFLFLNKKLEQILSRVLPNHLPSIAVNSKDDRFNSWLLTFGLDCNTHVYSILESSSFFDHGREYVRSGQKCPATGTL